MWIWVELRRRNVLRVAAAYILFSWLVVQVVETIFPAFGFSDTAIRNTVIVAAIGFVPALLFAWFFELTPEGLKQEKDVERDASITGDTAKRLDRLILVVLCVAVCYFTIDKFVLADLREAEIAQLAREEGRSDALLKRYGPTSIAVLPFADMSAESDQEYFSDGISEELLNLLAKIPELRVISRTSAFSFKGQDVDIPEIAERLNVDHVLEGSVRKSGFTVRITAQLIDAGTDSHLWSETYDRDMGNIFAVQDEIAAAVVDELKVNLLGEMPTVKTTAPEAYNLTLQADHLSDQLSDSSLALALDVYQRALEIDPTYVVAWTGLSTVYDRMRTLQLMPPEEASRLANEAANKAFALAPESAVAWELKAWTAMRQNEPLQTIATLLQQSLALDPTRIGTIGNAALFLSMLGREEEALRATEFQVSRDPANSVAYNNLGLRYRYTNRLAAAEQAFSTAITLNPGLQGAHYELAVTRLLREDIDGAEAAIGLENNQIFRNLGLAMVRAAQGRQAESSELKEAIARDYGDALGFYLAQAEAYANNADAAFDWLRRALAAGDTEVLIGINEPLLNNLRDDPRWAQFWLENGRSPEQLQRVQFTLTLPRQQAEPRVTM